MLRPALHVRPFVGRSHRLLWPLLTSADPSRRLAAPVAHPPRRGQDGRPPRVKRATFAPSTCRIYADTLRMTLGFRFLGPLARVSSPLCASCSSGRSFAYSFLRTPPRGDALAVRLAVPVIKARRGLSPPSRPTRHHSGAGQRQIMALRAMPGAPKENGRARGPAVRGSLLRSAVSRAARRTAAAAS